MSTNSKQQVPQPQVQEPTKQFLISAQAVDQLLGAIAKLPWLDANPLIMHIRGSLAELPVANNKVSETAAPATEEPQKQMGVVKD